MNRFWLWAREIRWLAVLALLAGLVGLVLAIVAVVVHSLLLILLGTVLVFEGHLLLGLDRRR